MSYGKKDEDADLGLVKVDRTQVFQEGKKPVHMLDTSSNGASFLTSSPLPSTIIQ